MEVIWLYMGPTLKLYQGLVWPHFECLQEWRSHKISVKPALMFDHTHSKEFVL